MDYFPLEIENIIMNYKVEFEKINPYKKYYNKLNKKDKKDNDYIIIPLKNNIYNIKNVIAIFICKKYLYKNKYEPYNTKKDIKNILNNIYTTNDLNLEKIYLEEINYIVLDNYEQYNILKILNLPYNRKKLYNKNKLIQFFIKYLKK